MSENKKEKKNIFGGVVKYFKEVKSELKKTVWPTFSQVRNNTIIVIVCVAIVALIIAVLDLGFGATIGKVFDLAKGDVVVEEATDTVDLGEGIEVPVEEGGILGDAVPGGELPTVVDGEVVEVPVEESGAVTDGE